MIPRTLSASSLQVASLCLVRWNAEYMDRIPGFSNPAADVGTAVHGGLEMFVKAVYIDKTHADLDRVKQKELLITFYQMSYVQTFGTADMETPEYKDGFQLSMKWFERTDLSKIEGVISVEEKRGFEIPFYHPDGPAHATTEPCERCAGKNTPGICYVPFNFLMDRLDKVGPGRYRVVDYKTIRIPITMDDLVNKIQARAYALAIQIMFPDAVHIEVVFDLLRHEKVGIEVTAAENQLFWNYLCAELQRLVNQPVETIEPTLNKECQYCVVNVSCPLMTKNLAGGGLMSKDIHELAMLYEQLENQIKANARIVESIGEMLMMHANQTEVLDWETPDGAFEVGVGLTSGRRAVNAQRASEIMGPELFGRLGSLTVGKVEELIKDPNYPLEMREALKETLYKNNGNLKPYVKRKQII